MRGNDDLLAMKGKDSRSITLLLADDDLDDCLFFREALDELPVSASLMTVSDGEQLMRRLKASETPPDILFLDLNMPRKNGFECLAEIKDHEKLKSIPVVIYSTSLDKAVVDLLYEKGADRYVQKPGDFKLLKSVIDSAIALVNSNVFVIRSKENFVITF